MVFSAAASDVIRWQNEFTVVVVGSIAVSGFTVWSWISCILVSAVHREHFANCFYSSKELRHC